MKPFITTLMLFAFCKLAAQPTLPDFGKIEKADLEITNCSFEQNAKAMVLFDVGEFYCNIYPSLMNPVMIQNERRIRIKILKDKGLDEANIHIRYNSFGGNEIVKGLSAVTYNLDATGNVITTKVDKKSIFEKKINKRITEIAFSFPEVKVGSVIEYKYTIEGSGRSNWYFQKNIPVVLSQFTIDFPTELEVRTTPYCSLPYERKRGSRGRDMETFSMQNIPSLHDESYITCEEDYLQRLETRLVAVNFAGSPRRSLTLTWPNIIRSLMDDIDFGVQLKRNIPRTADLDLLLKDVTDPYRKMCIIHEYVRKNMQWNEYDNIWALDGVKSAWKDKKGTSGEINLILVNLLKDAGLNAHPVLVSTQDHGRVNTFIPEVSQFNKVMAYIQMNDRKYVLDGTEKFTATKLIPTDVIATQGLVIEKIDTEEWGWQTLWNEDDIYKDFIIVNGQIDKDGIMKGDASVMSYDYSRIERMPKLKEGKTAFLKAFYSQENGGAKVDSIDFENEYADSLPLVQKFSFSKPVNTSGDYQYFNTNMFAGLEKNPFEADNRFSDIFFGYNQQITIVGNYTAPDGYIFEELPKNIRMMMPDTSINFTRLAALNENTASMKITLDFKKPVYSVEEYPEFREFYKKLFDLLNEQFVIKKKS
ncbi:MAG: DUF3857 domain-containing protein [Ferruginibacter sp.]